MAVTELGLLGWAPPQDRSHELRFSMSVMPTSTPCPVVIGVNWYTAFDRPTKDDQGYYWIGRSKDLGTVRGGHCVCLRPPAIPDLVGAQIHWNQRSEGACVGFGVSRAASLYNRRLYDGFGLYHKAQTRDNWAGEDYVGTSVNAGLKTLRLDGAWLPGRNGSIPIYADGCSSYIWASSATDVTKALQSSEPFVRILNSWGAAYPVDVRMPLETLERLFDEGAECGVPIDRPGRMKIRVRNGE